MAVGIQPAMPQFFQFAEHDLSETDMRLETEEGRGEKAKRSRSRSRNMWGRLSFHKLQNMFKREELGEPPPAKLEKSYDVPEKQERGHYATRRGPREVVPGLPRPITFRRQNSERRDRLFPIDSNSDQRRRAKSLDRRTSSLGPKRTLSPPVLPMQRNSAPEVWSPLAKTTTESLNQGSEHSKPTRPQEDDDDERDLSYFQSGDLPPHLSAHGDFTDRGSVSDSVDDYVIQEELEAKWILNLSMHFRDKSDREKFFITYAEEPNKWRRVTVSCDYRGVPSDSLEADLKSLHYQRDKSARIYEAIRDSLPAIQFYNTVTNLKLQTADGRLHVHVTEDVNEIIPYPSISAVKHLPGPRFRESDVRFESHISGFVYKVNVEGRTFIKKEIPGPDSVEEFLYEVNALCTLQGSQYVIKYEGLVIDDTGELVKGLLISFAEQGALVDVIFDWKGTNKLHWPRREKWAKQIVHGLSEIHEAGFVQGDFTLSNIVIDDNDDAKIIDINRRGCPVGWEPPELSTLIESGHRISIYIGVKSDLFQLGMVLWAITEEQDEPERQERPFGYTSASHDVPTYFKEIVDICLSADPKNRLSAKDLLARFPAEVGQDELSKPPVNSRNSISTHRSDKEYIDPATAVDLEDIENSRRLQPTLTSIADDLAFVDGATSSAYGFGSSGSYVVPLRGRSRDRGHGGTSTSFSASRGRRSYNYSRSPATRVSSVSLNDSELGGDCCPSNAQNTHADTRWAQVYLEDGNQTLVHRDSFGVVRGGELTDERQLRNLPTPPLEMSQDSISPLTKPSESPQKLQMPPELPPLASVAGEPVVQITLPPSPRLGCITEESRRPEISPQPSLTTTAKNSISLERPQTPPRSHASFHDRAQQRRSYDSSLAEVEKEILNLSVQNNDNTPLATQSSGPEQPIKPIQHWDSGFAEFAINEIPEPAKPPRSPVPVKRTSFGPPLHHDSGFEDDTFANKDDSKTSALYSDPPKIPILESLHEETTEQMDEEKAREAVRRIMTMRSTDESLKISNL
jgi:serine/threonine protein kinase